MCSSSLTAIHLACESLRHGQCTVAVAGGVNVSIHPNKYLGLSQGRFASSHGRCESFGEGGDGYVPGEGVGAVLLKPLAQALRDQDQIQGVICGSSINHGGKTNGYTVPNPQAQAQAIEQALQQAQVNARSISYLEAHGTGTVLGDPIEIAALTQAFSKYTQDRQFCAIGSAKSNIGHLESAAGIAGLAKVLLQMRHGTLVPSLHSQVLNPHIEFEKTPFRVQQQLQPWERPKVRNAAGEERESARIAGLSSFGAGGSNAHLIIQEYLPDSDPLHPPVQITPQRPALIVLSARSEPQLQSSARRLLEYVGTHFKLDADLAHIAYTLQVGREAMDHRLAFTAASLQELQDKLASYLEGKITRGERQECYCGQIQESSGALSMFNTEDVLQTALATWIRRGEYAKLLQLWVEGIRFEWDRLYVVDEPYAEIVPRRVSLPTCSFSNRRCWITVAAPAPTPPGLPVQPVVSAPEPVPAAPPGKIQLSALSGHPNVVTAMENVVADRCFF